MGLTFFGLIATPDYHTKNTNRRSQASERQGGALLPLQLLLSPYVAAGIPAAGATAIAVYGSYGDDIRRLYNSLFREFGYVL